MTKLQRWRRRWHWRRHRRQNAHWCFHWRRAKRDHVRGVLREAVRHAHIQSCVGKLASLRCPKLGQKQVGLTVSNLHLNVLSCLIVFSSIFLSQIRLNRAFCKVCLLWDVSAQLSNKFGYCPSCIISIVLAFLKHYSLPLGHIRSFIPD